MTADSPRSLPSGPCDVCRRFHRGRCTPADQRTVKLCLTLPGRVDRLLRHHIPWGDRSKFVARLVERELDRIEQGTS